MVRLAGFLVVIAVLACQINAAEAFAGTRTEVYKQIGNSNLVVHIFEPTGVPATNRAAIVFFFGGGWNSGTPAQFEPHCRHFASRGMVAFAADYRVKSRHGVQPVACVADAKSCVRWIRQNAGRLGVDPGRIAAGGGSAGGHLAAATATLPEFDEPAEDSSVSSVPNALVLFNPALVLAPLDGMDMGGFGTRVGKERLGAEPRDLSPGHHVQSGTPPAIIFHGKADQTVPYSTAEAFTAAMKKHGNRCELVGFEAQGHGFFNVARGDGRCYDQTLAAADAFLVSLGFLSGSCGP
ncbi:MAG: alpha/beta hydrolase [Verrucomicrobia bacterium]|nr:alpha/beta hydrolase [Verrucomicrobiota bacterium]